MATHQPGPARSEFARRLIENDPATTDPHDAAAGDAAGDAAEGYETTDEDDQRFDAG